MIDQKEPSSIEKLIFRNGIKTVIGACLIYSLLGHGWVYGTIEIYVTSYLRLQDPEVTLNDTYIMMPTVEITSTIFLYFGVILTQTIGYKISALLSVLIVLSSQILIFIVASNWFIFIMLYASAIGLANGIMWVSLLECCWTYFPWIKGRISGICTLNAPLQSFFFAILCTYIANPDNKLPTIEEKVGNASYKYFNEEVALNAPKVFTYLLVIYSIQGFIGVLLLQRPTEEEQNALNEKEQRILQERENALEKPLLTKQAVYYTSVKQAVCSSTFFMIFIMSLFSSCFLVFINAVSKNFAINYIDDDNFLSVVGAVSQIFNGVMRLPLSYLVDWKGFTVAYKTVLITELICSGLIYFLVEYRGLYLILICMSLACLGGHYTIFPPFIMDSFGKELGSRVYGLFYYSFLISSLLGIAFVKLILPVIFYIDHRISNPFLTLFLFKSSRFNSIDKFWEEIKQESGERRMRSSNKD